MSEENINVPFVKRSVINREQRTPKQLRFNQSIAKYYHKNRDVILEKMRDYYKSDHYKQLVKEWKEKNKEYLLEYKRAYEYPRLKEKLFCEDCQVEYSRCHKSCHMKSKRHLRSIGMWDEERQCRKEM